MINVIKEVKGVVFEVMIVVRFDDGAEDALFTNKSLVTIVTRDDYRNILKKIHLCKTMGLESLVVKWDNPIWTVNTTPEDLEKQLIHITPDEAIKTYGNVRDDNPLGTFEMTIDNIGGVYLEAPHNHTYGKAISEILIKELQEVFGEIEVGTALHRAEVMEFWRSSEMPEELIIEDRLEIFATAPVGQSDLSKETLDEILADYGVENIKVFDKNDKIELPTLLLAKNIAVKYNENIKERIRLYEDDDNNAAFDLESDLREQGAELAAYILKGYECKYAPEITTKVLSSSLHEETVSVLLEENSDYVPTGLNIGMIFETKTLIQIMKDWEPEENHLHTSVALAGIELLYKDLVAMEVSLFALIKN